jgi:hypothetical protein
MTLQLLHSEFFLYMRKILFNFLSVHPAAHISTFSTIVLVERVSSTNSIGANAREKVAFLSRTITNRVIIAS